MRTDWNNVWHGIRVQRLLLLIFIFIIIFLIVKNYSQNILVMVIDVCFIHTIIIEGTLVWKNLLV